MPRPLRIEYPNAWYHVMNRGAARRKIFNTDEHRELFLSCLEEATEMFDIEIHAYCLMDNHYHLLIRTPNANLSRAMRHINGVYTQRYNRSRRTDGPLFRGRYKAKLIDEDSYLLVVSRYVHLNPIEAKLVSKPSQYKWSSYKGYMDDSKKPKWLFTKSIKKQLASMKSLSHVKNYKDYVENHDFEELAVFSSNKYTSPILGSKEFTEAILKSIDDNKKIHSLSDYKRAQPLPSIGSIIKQTMTHFDISQKQLTRSTRGQLNLPKLICLYICRKKYGYRLSEIATEFGSITPNTVGTTVGKCEKLLNTHVDIKKHINKICLQLIS